MELLEEDVFYKPALFASESCVPLNFYQADSVGSIDQFLVKMDFSQLCILRTTVTTELKL